MTKTRLLSLLPFAALACSNGAPVDIGHDQIVLADYAGHWDGYAEGYAFPEGNSDRVRLTLDENGAGTIQVGDAPLFPPFTDPDFGPPVSSTGPLGAFRDGVLYPVHQTVADGDRIRFGIDALEIYADWCMIVPSIPDPQFEGVYRCIETGGRNGCAVVKDDGTRILYDCSRYLPCDGNVCSCTASGCTYPRNYDHGFGINVDAVMGADGSSLVGTLAMGDRVTIRLQRQ
jgi:hypothetical protein